MAWLSALLKSLPFANSAMLLWGLAAALPILIHLLSKRHYREMPWAAMHFLLEAVRKNARRIRIEQLLLLLIRVAILLLLALALADPIWSLFPALGSALGSRDRTHFVLVIDGSYSMDCRTGEQSRFDVARQLAAQLLEDSRQGDGFTLVLMADPPQTVIAEPAFDPKDVLEEIDHLRIQHGGAGLSAALAEVEGVLQKAREQRSRLTDCRVCFFTDLGRTTWDDVLTEECRDRIGRLAEQATLLLFDVGQGDAENLAVTALDLRESLATVARELTIEAEVQHFGVETPPPGRVQLFVDGQPAQTQPLEVPVSGRASVSFTHRFETPGEHHIAVRLSDDPLPLDNQRWLSIPVREAIRVLCVQGQEGAARHVAWALEPARGERLRVRPDIRFESALLEADLQPYDCIFLCNVARFGREEAEALHEYLARGGGLVVTLGDQVQADSYNQQLGGTASGKRVLPARLEGLAPDAQYALDPLDYRHPIVAPFARHERSGLLTTPVWRYFKLTPYDQTTARVALGFQNGDPALIEERIQRGCSILLATAAGPDSLDRTTKPPTPWTALASWPSFPPLIHEMLSLAVRSRSAGRNVLVGEPLEGTAAVTAPDAAVTVTAPGEAGGERVPLTREGETGQWVYAATATSGLYAVQSGDGADDRHWYAVNVNPRESNLERFDSEQLPSQFRQDLGPVGQPGTPLPATRTAQYFRWFLGGLFGLLLLETFLAWYFGNASG